MTLYYPEVLLLNTSLYAGVDGNFGIIFFSGYSWLFRIRNNQDFSVAGNQAGAVWKCRDCGHEVNPLQVHWSVRDDCEKCGSKDLDKSRSSLLVEWLRMIRGTKPDFGIYENVKNIVGKKFRDTTFRLFEEELHEYGYHTYWAVLNAKNYGIPQNRERVYLILIKKELDNGLFVFPEPFESELRLKNLLEEEVEEKYYLKQDKVERLIKDMEDRKALLFVPDVKEKETWENKVKLVGQLKTGKKWKNPQTGRVYSPEGCSPALVCCQGGGQEPKIVHVGKVDAGQMGSVLSPLGIACTQTASNDQMKIIQLGNTNPCGYGIGGNVYFADGISPTLTTNSGEGIKVGAMRGRYDEDGNIQQKLEVCTESNNCHALTSVQKDNIILVRQATEKGYEECIANGRANLTYPNSKTKRGRVQAHGDTCPTLTAQTSGVYRLESLIRIRKLIPLECFRLMGFDDVDYQKVKQAGISNSQMYKQAGNSIVTDVLYYIYKELYKAMPYLFEDIKLASFFSGIGAFEKALNRFYYEMRNENLEE